MSYKLNYLKQTETYIWVMGPYNLICSTVNIVCSQSGISLLM